ncbi:MAG TPA: glycosyltransferase family 4 protein [Humisphaera sp.]|jgi:glycosyltransferase involved in cell wall biosynthesis|nr:glycosyltransferase family 4 protein [Humisphaera sp.]
MNTGLMKLHIIAPALPPTVDGIGSYSALLAAEIGQSATVTVLTATGADYDPIPSVRVVQAFDPRRRRSVKAIERIVTADSPDWIVLQFNQFSYGRWGLNPYLPSTLLRVLRNNPSCRLAVMFHEDFVPPISWKFKIMRQWQRRQFKLLGRAANVVFFSIEPWVRKYAGWFPGKQVLHLPVGSNITRVPVNREEMRRSLNIFPQELMLGVFGSVSAARNGPWINAATGALRHIPGKKTLLYIGADGAALASAMGLNLMAGVAERNMGCLPSDQVSRHLQVVDVFLSPFSDGVSTRRGSMMAALQHGLPTVATRGWATDDVLATEHGRSIMLADANSLDEYGSLVTRLVSDKELRSRIGNGASAFYKREFAWPRIAERMMAALAEHRATRRTLSR